MYHDGGVGVGCQVCPKDEVYALSKIVLGGRFLAVWLNCEHTNSGDNNVTLRVCVHHVVVLIALTWCVLLFRYCGFACVDVHVVHGRSTEQGQPLHVGNLFFSEYFVNVVFQLFKIC